MACVGMHPWCGVGGRLCLECTQAQAAQRGTPGQGVVPEDQLASVTELPAPTVVCASCGRTVDRPPRDGIGRECEVPEWHQPQPYVPDADVAAEDGDDLVPMDDDDWQAAVGPRPGQTWADLYGRTHVALSYKGAQLEGVTRELLRTRQLLHVAQEELRTRASEADALTTDTMRLLAAIVRQHGSVRPGGSTELRLPERAMLQPAGQVSWYDDPATGDRVWRVQP